MLRLSSSCRYVIDAGVTFEAAVDTAGAELVAGTPLEDVVVGGAEPEVREKAETVDDGIEVAATEVVLAVIAGIEGTVLDDSDSPAEGALVAVLVDRENVNGPLDPVVLEELPARVAAGNRLVVLAPGNENPLVVAEVVAAEVVAAEVVAAEVVDVLGPNENPVEDGAGVVAGAAGVARLKVNPDDVEAGVEPKENPVEETGAADVTAVVLVAAGVAPKLNPVAADAVDPKLNPAEGAVEVGGAGDEKRPDETDGAETAEAETAEAETVGVCDPNPKSPVLADVAAGVDVDPKLNPVEGGAAVKVVLPGVVPRPIEGVDDPNNPL